jgi:hypothetical protein
MGQYSREAENLEGVPIVYSVQSHDHLEYAAKSLVIIQVVCGLRVDVLRKNENSEVNFHLPRSCNSIVARTKTRLMKAYEELAFNRQVDNGLDDHGQYVEPTVQ